MKGRLEMKKFDKNNNRLCNQFDYINWIEESGVCEKELKAIIDSLTENKDGLSKAMIKAKSFKEIAEKSRIAVDIDDIFQDKLFSGNLILSQRYVWGKQATDQFMPEKNERSWHAWIEHGAYRGDSDFGHTSPNSKLLLDVGFVGLLNRVKEASKKEGLSNKQKVFYNACIVTLEAAIVYLDRLAEAIKPYNDENSRALKNLTKYAPSNIYEAMQLLIAYFFFHEYVGGTRVRTLGRLDVLLYPFYKNDIENGTYTKEEIKEMLKFFLNKFWTAKVPADLPFCLCGIDSESREVTNEISYLIIETYNELNIYSPKIHIRVSDKTPKSLIKLVLSCIRSGNSSFVFVNDEIAIKSLMNVGIEEKDAMNYLPIGCYEPAVWGVEIGCTGNGGVNLAKAVELVVTDGMDFRTGEPCGIKTGKINSYEEFIEAIKKQIVYLSEQMMDSVISIEKHYDKINPDPLLSAMYDYSVEQGIDVYEGGAKYNNSSIYYWCIASLVDSIAAVKKIVFEDKDVTFDELCEILKNNWQGYEELRFKAKNLCEKYGNNTAFANSIAVEISDFVSKISNNKPNGRGGVFKTALFSIDNYVPLGERMMATPDGRLSGEILSKNLCASVGMDRNGITALINSVTKMDLSKFPTGSVLDIVLHPSAVQGEEGLEAFYGILDTYFKKGGFAMHGNVFNAETLKAAQREPDKYKNLQVRVCGWNAYFVTLSKAEQDAFIKQAENV